MSDFEFRPKMATPAVEAGYRVPGNLYKIGKACDEWLAKRYHDEGRRPAGHSWKKSTTPRPPEPEKDGERRVKKLARDVARHIAAPKPKPKPKPKQSRRKYATDAERSAAISARTAALWANMDPVKKAERLEAMRLRKIKHPPEIPRHKRAGWLAYKREWERKRRKTHPLTEAQLEHRRAQGRKNDHARRAKRKAAAQAAKAAAAAS